VTPFSLLSRTSLESVAAALEGGRLQPPYTAPSLGRILSKAEVDSVVGELSRLDAFGMQPKHLGYWLRTLAEEKGRADGGRVELVWSGPESNSAESRDTAVVLRELFLSAETSVLISGFAVFDGRAIFQALADRMDAKPDLRARFFLNVARSGHDSTADSELVVRFARDFRKRHWPGMRFPEVYYDPRSLALEPRERASLHAKCAVIDSRRAFVTSANFTPAAQDRNIEAGVIIESQSFAIRLQDQFESLVARGLLKPVPL
jgi:phosphatidylserine/phosphatidylglycerophosphate/cardiolipin synthase-like enzyme